MKETIPYRKLWKLALSTTPLMALFGSTAVFAFERNQFERVSFAFVSIFCLMAVFWIINILLLRAWERFDPKWTEWIRYVLATMFCLLVMYLLFSIPFEGSRIPFGHPGSPPANFPANMPLPPKHFFIVPVLPALSINIIIMILMELVLLREKKLRIESENAQLKLANLEARHGRLKQQLHPHFLFNSLSTLRSLIKRSPTDAENYLERLSELLRYSAANESQALISLKEELEFSRNYLDMQQVRFGDALRFSFAVPESLQQNGLLPIYSIQLLVENAIKHNSLTATWPLFIQIKGDCRDNSIVVVNNIQKKTDLERASGIGLKNLSERYQLLGKGKVRVEYDDHEFYVTLKILRDENSDY